MIDALRYVEERKALLKKYQDLMMERYVLNVKIKQVKESLKGSDNYLLHEEI